MLTFLFFWSITCDPLGFVSCFEVQTSDLEMGLDQLEMGLELPDRCGSNWGRYLGMKII